MQLQSPKQSQNPYEILNLPEKADYQTIRERYYQFSKAFHPDKQPLELYEESKRYFLMIEEAYKSISSPFCRFLFNNIGKSGGYIYNNEKIERKKKF
jgi:DnaJ-class molecular chaperone